MRSMMIINLKMSLSGLNVIKGKVDLELDIRVNTQGDNMKDQTKTICVPLNSYDYLCHGYVYNKCAPKSVKGSDCEYVGLSLEEIEEKFGKDTANMVYSLAALGAGDLTSDSNVVEPTDINIIQCVDVCIQLKNVYEGDCTTGVLLIIELLSNRLTAAISNKEIHRSFISNDCLAQDQQCTEFIIHKIITHLGVIDTDNINKVKPTGE